jgi:hypothetical protein
MASADVYFGRGQTILLERERIKRNTIQKRRLQHWPAPGSEDTELGVLMELEVGHGETEVYA